mmetsp:Transcript_6434/g.22134  ORF Transcript_6434/g.22134 Transcript_6434/m.22134 type:complete len:204 (-) Transcript_6434:3271-3882(-)
MSQRDIVDEVSLPPLDLRPPPAVASPTVVASAHEARRPRLLPPTLSPTASGLAAGGGRGLRAGFLALNALPAISFDDPSVDALESERDRSRSAGRGAPPPAADILRPREALRARSCLRRSAALVRITPAGPARNVPPARGVAPARGVVKDSSGTPPRKVREAKRDAPELRRPSGPSTVKEPKFPEPMSAASPLPPSSPSRSGA